MIYGSVCSGIEAATVAWQPLGWQAAFFAEIEAFPSAVLKERWPNVPNLGDITKFGEWKHADIDVLVGGTPCQSFSVAGLRKGLADPRGNLALTYLAIADKYRPRWLVWENVPGVLSANSGRDFGSFLGALGQLGYGFAYRILDAQYFGVPQRRRRVFVVGYFGDWRPAAAVLFERHSLSGHSAPRRKTGQKTTGTLSSRTSRSGGLGTDFECGGSGSGRIDFESETFVTSFCGEKMHALTASHDASEDGTGRGTRFQETCIGSKALTSGHNREQKNVLCFAENTRGELRLEGGDGLRTGTLSTGGGKPGQGQPVIAFSCKDSGADAHELSPTLRAMNHAQSHANAGGQVAIALNIHGRDGGATAELGGDISNTLRASQGGEDKQHIFWGTSVRRLTPMECERLQGFPDHYTKIPWRNRPTDQCADGPRYKALGNSMAVPVMRWLGNRIAMVDKLITGK